MEPFRPSDRSSVTTKASTCLSTQPEQRPPRMSRPIVPCSRQACTSVRMVAAERLPSGVRVPWLVRRHKTTGRIIPSSSSKRNRWGHFFTRPFPDFHHVSSSVCCAPDVQNEWNEARKTDVRLCRPMRERQPSFNDHRTSLEHRQASSTQKHSPSPGHPRSPEDHAPDETNRAVVGRAVHMRCDLIRSVLQEHLESVPGEGGACRSSPCRSC